MIGGGSGEEDIYDRWRGWGGGYMIGGRRGRIYDRWKEWGGGYMIGGGSGEEDIR